MPYSGMTNPEVLKYVAEEGKRLEMPRAAPVPVFEVMKRCWATVGRRFMCRYSSILIHGIFIYIYMKIELAF